MSTAELMHGIDELDGLLRLSRDAQTLVPKPRERHKLLAELACIETRLCRMRYRMIEAALSELLWRYLELSAGTGAEPLARQMLTEILGASPEAS